MKHTDYLVIIKQKIKLLRQNSLLFWDLWCLNYVFKKIKNQEYEHYQDIYTAYKLLWDYNDHKILLESIFDNQSVHNIMHFDNEDFENLDDFEVEEKANKEIIVGLESVLGNLKEYGQVIFNAYEIPIDVVDIEIDETSISMDK